MLLRMDGRMDGRMNGCILRERERERERERDRERERERERERAIIYTRANVSRKLEFKTMCVFITNSLTPTTYLRVP